MQPRKGGGGRTVLLDYFVNGSALGLPKERFVARGVWEYAVAADKITRNGVTECGSTRVALFLHAADDHGRSGALTPSMDRIAGAAFLECRDHHIARANVYGFIFLHCYGHRVGKATCMGFEEVAVRCTAWQPPWHIAHVTVQPQMQRRCHALWVPAHSSIA